MYKIRERKINTNYKNIHKQLPETGFVQVFSKNLYLLPNDYQQFAINGIQQLYADINVHDKQTINSINTVPNSKFLFYVKNNEVTGMLRYYRITDCPITNKRLNKFNINLNKCVYLTSLFVSEKHRNQGIASTLITNIIQPKLTYCLSVLKTNKTAIKLYEKLGFKKYGDTHGNKAWFMVKI